MKRNNILKLNTIFIILTMAFDSLWFYSFSQNVRFFFRHLADWRAKLRKTWKTIKFTEEIVSDVCKKLNFIDFLLLAASFIQEKKTSLHVKHQFIAVENYTVKLYHRCRRMNWDIFIAYYQSINKPEIEQMKSRLS